MHSMYVSGSTTISKSWYCSQVIGSPSDALPHAADATTTTTTTTTTDDTTTTTNYYQHESDALARMFRMLLCYFCLLLQVCGLDMQAAIAAMTGQKETPQVWGVGVGWRSLRIGS